MTSREKYQKELDAQEAAGVYLEEIPLLRKLLAVISSESQWQAFTICRHERYGDLSFQTRHWWKASDSLKRLMQTTNRLYVWQSKALAGWEDGQIIICTENVEKARTLVLDRAKAYFSKSCWDEKAREKYISEIKSDISAEPKTDEVFFVWGTYE